MDGQVEEIIDQESALKPAIVQFFLLTTIAGEIL